MNNKKINIKIEKNYFHLNADKILNNNGKISSHLHTSFNSTISLPTRQKKTGKSFTEAFYADDLNIELRRLLETDTIIFEVYEKDGVFHFGHKSKNGFDFAFIDHKKNLINMWNNCFGKRVFSNGDKLWKNFLSVSSHYDIMKDELKLDEYEKGSNITCDKTQPIIVGEIQFGNWGLGYYDLFKVIKANILMDVDALVYITSVGKLTSYLSDGIVTFEKMRATLKDFKKVIPIPIWLIGLDFTD